MSDMFISNDEIEQNKRRNNIVDFNSYSLDIKPMSQMKASIQPWFWSGMIPGESLTLFGGHGGIGKSLLLLYIAAHTSNGKAFKAGGFTHQLPHGSVLLLSAEDDPEYQIKPKLLATNADMDKIYYSSVKITDHSKIESFIDLDTDTILLEREIQKIGDVKLIIIDPITYFTGQMKDHINREVANFLNKLIKLAKKYQIAILLNKHLRKQGSGAKGVSNAVSEIGGAGAWTNTPRKCWLITNHHEDADIKIITQMKDNLSKNDTESLAYKIIPVTVYENGLSINTTVLQWCDEKISITSDEALDKQTYETTKLDQTVALIYDYLKENGQALIKNISQFVQSKGITSRTFRRACTKFELDYKECLKISRGMKNAKMYMLEDE